MNKSVRERELKQFKAMLWAGGILYPFWLIYGLWSGNHDAPIIVGFVAAWAIWYIKLVKSKAEGADTKQPPDWYSFSIDKHINIPILVGSLGAVVLVCLSILVAIRVFNN